MPFAAASDFTATPIWSMLNIKQSPSRNGGPSVPLVLSVERDPPSGSFCLTSACPLSPPPVRKDRAYARRFPPHSRLQRHFPAARAPAPEGRRATSPADDPASFGL